MKYGLFMMPSHPPERNIYDAHQWDLNYLALCDALVSLDKLLSYSFVFFVRTVSRRCT